jgi:hypothetical protein
MRGWAIAAIATLLVTAAWSQEPAPPSGTQKEQPQTAEPAQQRPAEPQTASPAPSIIYVQPPAKSAEEAEEERRERHEKTELDRRLVELTAELSSYTGGLYRATIGLVLATIILAIATFGLVIFEWRQVGDMKESIDVARRSARAAEINTQITLATQRAQLDILKFQTEVLGVPGTLIGFIVRAIWKNFGSTFALRIATNIQVVVVPSEEVDQLTFVVKPRKVDDPFVDLAPGNDISTQNVPIRPAQAMDAWQKKSRIFVYTRMAYNDVIEIDGPKRRVVEVCNEVFFASDPHLLQLPATGLGPFTAELRRYSAYRIVDQSEVGEGHTN